MLRLSRIWTLAFLLALPAMIAGPALAQRNQDRPPLESKASIGLVSLADMTAEVDYRGQDGGLYGQGRNTPPEAHMKLAMAAASRFNRWTPRDDLRPRARS